MKKQTLVRDATVMLLALFAAYAMVMLTQAVMGRIEGVAMLIFMLAVFVTSMYTEGYAWGVAASLISVLAVNFAFLGQFAETARDTIFTTEYSIRTGMEAVYSLLDIDRGVPEVWGSTYDVRDLVNASVALRDGRKITDMDLGVVEKLALKELLKKVRGTDVEKLLAEHGAI